MRLGMGNGTYLIHGTNNPIAVGMAVTHGCVRMYPEDIEALFPLVPIGTKVSLINEPIKLAYSNGEFWLEAHPPIRVDSDQPAPSLETLSDMLVQLAGEKVTAIHWDFAREALEASTGVTTMIGLEIPRSVQQLERRRFETNGLYSPGCFAPSNRSNSS